MVERAGLKALCAGTVNLLGYSFLSETVSSRGDRERRAERRMVENVKELLKAHEQLKREVYLDIENSSAVSARVGNDQRSCGCQHNCHWDRLCQDSGAG